VTGRLTLTVPEAAEALGVSQRHLHNCIASGLLPARRLGRRVLIPVEALNEWLRGAA
jgi:excisionase family DNA binding protein